MNILTNLVFIFIFIYILLYFGMDHVDPDNIIQHKLYLFIGIFIFQFFIQIIYKIANKYQINISTLASESFHIATASIIGYSIYTDLIMMPKTSKYIDKYVNNEYYMCAIISSIIVFFISISQFTMFTVSD